jgi:AcrR family transcriptional regulator
MRRPDDAPPNVTQRQIDRTARHEAREAIRRQRGEHRDGDPTGEAGTRARIQQVALQLFTDRGYEATSLREIAEHIGVTKAALYYHFKTKDDIIESLVRDRAEKLEELISWAEDQPPGIDTRQEFLRRYADLFYQPGHHALMRFFERNQSSMTKHKAGEFMRARIVRMLEILTDRSAPVTDQIRCSLAIFALHSTIFAVRNPDITDAQRREAALEVALDLVQPAHPIASANR